MRLFSLLILFIGFAINTTSAQLSDSEIAKCAKAQGMTKAECAKRCSGWASKASLLSIAVLDTETNSKKACSYGKTAMASGKLVSTQSMDAAHSKSLKKAYSCKYSKAKCSSKSKASLAIKEEKKKEKKLTRA